MRILLTGVSSFTGAWLAKALADDGHEVVGTCRQSLSHYDGLRGRRLRWIQDEGVQIADRVSFGSSDFLKLLDRGVDILCHHAAEVADYRSPEFDVAGAVASNTLGIRDVLHHGLSAGLRAVVATGSVFEPGEGAGEPPLRAFSAYGLSKALSWEIISFQALSLGVRAAKFVIPNPFGMFEEPRFCGYLLKCWTAGEPAEVKTPDYVRDNIPVDKLAMAYAAFVSAQGDGNQSSPSKLNPSGYIETQGAFAQRFAREIGSRMGLKADLILARQTEFPEPRIRVNMDSTQVDWNEEGFWDNLSFHYKSLSERYA